MEGARDEPGAGGARQGLRPQPGRWPKADLREGGATVEVWLTTAGGQLTEMKPVKVETQVELKSRCAHTTLMALETEAEPQQQTSEVKPVC